MLPLPFKRKTIGKLNNREIIRPIMITLTFLTILLLSATTSDSLSNIGNNQASAQGQIISNNSNIQIPNDNSSNQNFNNSISIDSSSTISKPIDTLNATGLIESIIIMPGGLSSSSSSLPGSQGSSGISNNNSSSSNGVNASSSSSSIAFPPSPQSLLFGKWFMNVKKGNVTNFVANFVMFKPVIGGVHNIYNFGGVHTVYNITGFKAEKVDNNTNFVLNPSGLATINGTSNIAVNGTAKWARAHTTIAIDKFLVLRLQLDPKDIDNHFGGQPIYGSVMSLTGPNGTSIVKRPINFDTSS